METHSSILAWKILWREEPDRWQSLGLQRVGHNWATEHYCPPTPWYWKVHLCICYTQGSEVGLHFGDSICLQKFTNKSQTERWYFSCLIWLKLQINLNPELKPTIKQTRKWVQRREIICLKLHFIKIAGLEFLSKVSRSWLINQESQVR